MTNLWNRMDDLVEQTKEAYALKTEMYTKAEWYKALTLLAIYLTDDNVVNVALSKHMRWASDCRKQPEFKAAEFLEYLKNNIDDNELEELMG